MKKKTLFLLLCALTALMLLMLPVIIPSGSMLGDYQDQWSEHAWDSDALRFLIVPEASAEEAPGSLPIDLSVPGKDPNPGAYTENGYEDDSISDICKKIERIIFEENKRMLIEDGRLDEIREDLEDEYEDEDEMPTDDELVEQEMGNWHVCYPKELQDLEAEE